MIRHFHPACLCARLCHLGNVVKFYYRQHINFDTTKFKFYRILIRTTAPSCGELVWLRSGLAAKSCRLVCDWSKSESPRTPIGRRRVANVVSGKAVPARATFSTFYHDFQNVGWVRKVKLSGNITRIVPPVIVWKCTLMLPVLSKIQLKICTLPRHNLEIRPRRGFLVYLSENRRFPVFPVQVSFVFQVCSLIFPS